jgi:hypothetical protein
MTKSHPLFLEVASQLRDLAADDETEWSFSNHAEEEMLNDGLDYPDVIFVIEHCKIVRGEREGDSWYCLAEGKTADGILAGFPVRFSTDERYIEIISAWRI